MTSLPYPLNWLYNHGRVGMAGMPYPPTDCRSYIKINMNTYLILSGTRASPLLIINIQKDSRSCFATPRILFRSDHATLYCCS